MTLVDYVVYCNSKCHYRFRHSLTFLCMDKHYFKHCALLDNIFVGKLFTRWSCAWFSTIMSIISQFLISSIRTLLSLGTVVMFSWHYHRCWRRGGFIACLLGGCLLILFYKPSNNDFFFWHFKIFLCMWAKECDATAEDTSLTTLRKPRSQNKTEICLVMQIALLKKEDLCREFWGPLKWVITLLLFRVLLVLYIKKGIMDISHGNVVIKHLVTKHFTL